MSDTARSNGPTDIAYTGGEVLVGVRAPSAPAILVRDGRVAVVDRNPITCELDALPQTRVLRTMVGGRVVHDSGALEASGATAPTS